MKEDRIRDPKFYGRLMKYKLIVLCPYCHLKQGYIPRKRGELYPTIPKDALKTCVRCGKRFSVRGNIIREEEVRKDKL